MAAVGIMLVCNGTGGLQYKRIPIPQTFFSL
jgi:hypothetical protein